MDPNFWLERWQKKEIGFHQADMNPALVNHWPTLELTKGASVFVPLCGKSLDMVWLAEQGHSIFGVELSELAIDEFFVERESTPETEKVGNFTVKSSGPFQLWCGDFFALPKTGMPKIDGIYDRGSLVAIPTELQPRYAEKIAELAAEDAKILLIGLDYNPAEMTGPPFAIPQSKVRELFCETFDIALLEARDGLAKSEHLKKRGVTELEEATYLLSRRA